MDIMLEERKPDFEKAINQLRQKFGTIRTGQATPALVENILVGAYNTKMPLKQVASISVPEPRVITIQPWDRTIIKAIESALGEANLGCSPATEGEIIRLSIPPPNEERRKEIVRELKEIIEKTRIAIRQVRDEIRSKIQEMAKNKEITEDDKYIYFKDMDKMTEEYNKEINKLGEEKEREVMRI